jgi:HrpA-like RNA helicase
MAEHKEKNKEKYLEKSRSTRKAYYQRTYKPRPRVLLTKEQKAERRRSWVEANRHRLRELARRHREKDRAAYTAKLATWYEQNRERAKANAIAWRKENADRAAALSAAKRAIKAAASVDLTAEERERIVAIYRERDKRTAETGIPHHVDHIIPLSRGGKHHPDNLQILTAVENMKKRTKLPEEVLP